MDRPSKDFRISGILLTDIIILLSVGIDLGKNPCRNRLYPSKEDQDKTERLPDHIVHTVGPVKILGVGSGELQDCNGWTQYKRFFYRLSARSENLYALVMLSPPDRFCSAFGLRSAQ